MEVLVTAFCHPAKRFFPDPAPDLTRSSDPESDPTSSTADTDFQGELGHQDTAQLKGLGYPLHEKGSMWSGLESSSSSENTFSGG